MRKIESGLVAFLMANILAGLVLASHETLWPWAFIPGSIIWGMIILGFELERREQKKI